MTDDAVRPPKRRADQPDDVRKDASAAFTYKLATNPPIKDVAAVKAASDMYEAAVADDDFDTARPRKRKPA